MTWNVKLTRHSSSSLFAMVDAIGYNAGAWWYSLCKEPRKFATRWGSRKILPGFAGG
eukprot:CAMPEP_0172945688 /NCGR_PEP_ID=MMETSP1075-20121228/226679_1 /TAXON_ID=2916 /ORGANISM="Ceratium fusus, Strain PA161109" /LENGTH=56 /DNA_ID=CAMNT_0013807129 /DNA_START=1524 /DNA_END=1694 /DNA_ORIENTATION=-